MASETITTNAASSWQVVRVEGDAVHVAVHGTFDGATVAVEQEINGTAYPVLDEGTAIEFTASADIKLNVSIGDRIRLNTTGGGGSLALDFNIAGAQLVR